MMLILQNKKNYCTLYRFAALGADGRTSGQHFALQFVIGF